MNDRAHAPAKLAARRNDAGVLLVQISGDWLDRKGLPDIAAVEREVAGGGVRALECDARGLGQGEP